MNYNLCIQMPSSFNPEISQDDKFSMLADVLAHFTSSLIENDLCLSINEKESSYMLEGNQNITLQMKVKFQADVQKDQIKSLLKTFIPHQVGIVTFDETKAKFGVFIDSKSNFMDSDPVAIISDINELPDNLQTIEFIGIYANSASEKPKLNINFYDKNNIKFNITDSWVEQLREAYGNTFTASDIDPLPLSYLIRLMIGKTPSKEVADAINTTLMITTPCMEDSMIFSKIKNLVDCPLFVDFE